MAYDPYAPVGEISSVSAAPESNVQHVLEEPTKQSTPTLDPLFEQLKTVGDALARLSGPVGSIGRDLQTLYDVASTKPHEVSRLALSIAKQIDQLDKASLRPDLLRDLPKVSDALKNLSGNVDAPTVKTQHEGQTT